MEELTGINVSPVVCNKTVSSLNKIDMKKKEKIINVVKPTINMSLKKNGDFIWTKYLKHTKCLKSVVRECRYLGRRCRHSRYRNLGYKEKITKTISIGGIWLWVENTLFSHATIPNMDTGIKIVAGVAIVSFGIKKSYNVMERIIIKKQKEQWTASISMEGETGMGLRSHKITNQLRLPDGNIITRTENVNPWWGFIVRKITGNETWGYEYSSYYPVPGTTIFQHERETMYQKIPHTQNEPLVSVKISPRTLYRARELSDKWDEEISNTFTIPPTIKIINNKLMIICHTGEALSKDPAALLEIKKYLKITSYRELSNLDPEKKKDLLVALHLIEARNNHEVRSTGKLSKEWAFVINDDINRLKLILTDNFNTPISDLHEKLSVLSVEEQKVLIIMLILLFPLLLLANPLPMFTKKEKKFFYSIFLVVVIIFIVTFLVILFISAYLLLVSTSNVGLSIDSSKVNLSILSDRGTRVIIFLIIGVLIGEGVRRVSEFYANKHWSLQIVVHFVGLTLLALAVVVIIKLS